MTTKPVTLYTTWTRMFGERFDQAYDSDPYGEWNLTFKEREQDYHEFMDRIEPILDRYGLTILGDGEIVGPVGLDVDLDELKKRLGEEI